MLAALQKSYESDDGLNPLLRAAVLGNVEDIQNILENGVNVNECNEIGQTALLAAAFANNTNACKILIENGAKVEVKDIGGFTPLHLSTDIAIVELLLDNIAIENKEDVINTKTKNGRTPLHEAALHGPAEKAVRLLVNKAQSDSIDIHGNSPFHYALARSENEDVAIVKALLEAGADVNKQNYYLQTPLTIACKQHQFMRQSISILLKAGADPMMQTNEGNTAVHMLFLGTNLFERNVSLDLLEEVVETNRACLKTANLFQQLPIHGALSKRNMEEIATRLLQYDPDTANVCDGMGKTILHLACEQNHIGILKQYIDNTNFEAMINKPDQLGRTILHYSCIFSKDGKSVKLILENKVFIKFNMIDCFGLTAYQYAQTRADDKMTMLTKLLDEQLADNFKAGTNNLKKNVHAEEPNSLDYLLSNKI